MFRVRGQLLGDVAREGITVCAVLRWKII